MRSVTRLAAVPRSGAAAARAADDAARAAGVDLIELRTGEEVAAAERVFTELWSTDGRPPVAAEVLRALSHSGNYVAGAVRDGALVGASAAWLCVGDPGARSTLHSHITGVRAGAQNGGAGFALKLHQRAWALRRAIDMIVWTFDPLIRRNAYFNLARLGAVVTEYHQHFYGDMVDAVNAGDDSDRCVASWDLIAARANPAPVEAPTGAVVLLDEHEGRPVAGDPVGEGAVALIAVPEDIQALRATDRALAREWRVAVRDALGGALAAGFVADGMTRSGRYVLRRKATP